MVTLTMLMVIMFVMRMIEIVMMTAMIVQMCDSDHNNSDDKHNDITPTNEMMIVMTRWVWLCIVMTTTISTTM